MTLYHLSAAHKHHHILYIPLKCKKGLRYEKKIPPKPNYVLIRWSTALKCAMNWYLKQWFFFKVEALYANLNDLKMFVFFYKRLF